MDDVMWHKQLIHPGDLINLLDKTPFQVENKKRDPKQITFEGFIAFTSNSDVYSHDPYGETKQALPEAAFML